MVRTPQAAIIAIISTNAGTASLAAREAVSFIARHAAHAGPYCGPFAQIGGWGWGWG